MTTKHAVTSTRQDFVVHLHLTDAPATLDWSGGVRFKPERMGLNYVRHDHEPNQWTVFVDAEGPRVLKSGTLSTHTTIRATWQSYQDPEHVPQWVRELMDTYTPTGFLEHRR